MKKPIRKANAMGPKSTAPKKMYKTAGGAQQYVRGNTSAERRETLKNAASASGTTKGIFPRIMAASEAEASKNISRIVGKKAAKTDGTVKMYDKFEKDWMKVSKREKK